MSKTTDDLFTMTLTERQWMRILVTLNGKAQELRRKVGNARMHRDGHTALLPTTKARIAQHETSAWELSQVAELITDRLGGVEDKAPAGWDCIPGDRDRD